MKNTAFTIISFIYVNVLNAQQILVFDQDLKKPISFVNVFYKFENKISDSDYCDQSGFVNISALKTFDVIEFSCIGYESKIYQKKDISDTVFLQKKSIVLDEIKIISRKNQSTTLIGYSQLKRKTTLSAYKGFEICQFLENTFNKPKAIQSFVFTIIKRENLKTAVRIHLYAKHKNKFEPGQELITEDIIRYFDGKTREKVEINLTPYNLELPIEGAFIGIEWLGIIDENTGKFVSGKNFHTDTRIALNDDLPQHLTFMSKSIKEHSWENMSEFENDMKKNHRIKNHVNTSFGLKVFDE